MVNCFIVRLCFTRPGKEKEWFGRTTLCLNDSLLCMTERGKLFRRKTWEEH